MFLFKGSNSNENNQEKDFDIFKKSICEAFLLYKKCLKEKEPKKIIKLVNSIGYKYVFLKEFVISVVWYMENLSKFGIEDDLLDAIKIVKDLLKYYPRSPFLFFILKKLYEYLNKN
ncbi:MAG: hypothetical protein ACK5XN_01930, partial [Bacteroidota bacterium]